MKERFVNNAKRSAAVYLLLLASTMLWAQGPNSSGTYYQNANGKSGSALKTAMCGIIYNHTEKSYDYLWTAFYSTDVRPNGDPNAGKIWDMYSNITNYTPVSSGSSYKKEGDCYNREHSWPQSWFGSNTPMYTDLHHIYPTDGFVNGKRSNYPFGETSNPTYTSANNFSKLGPCSYSGYTGTVFEPADEYKGDFARTYFYMVTCYEEKLADWYSGNADGVRATIDGSTYPAFQTWQLNMLMKWAKNDPVSQKEIARNNAVYAIQANRNPFIDYPGLEEYIWGTMTANSFSYDNYQQPGTSSTTTVATPVISGTTPFTTSTSVTITCSTSGATIYYTTDGSTPSATNGTQYTAQFTLTATTTVKAIAIKDNISSSVATQTFTKSEGTSGNTLLYEGLSKYSSTNDGSAALEKNSDDLDYSNWKTLTKVFAGSKSTAQSNGGCLKLGSSSDAGSLTTGNISLTGSGTLTFYLKQYGSDTGKLNVTVNGATADVTQFTPSSGWTLCTVNLTNATGTVTITLATSSKRAYIDEITLISGSSAPVNTAPTWSNFPTNNTVIVGEDYELNINSYVSGTPDPLIFLSESESDDAEFDGATGDFLFSPTEAGTYHFTFTASNSEGSADATLTVKAIVTVPTLTADMESSTATSVPVSWTACDDVTAYTLQLASDDQFTANSAGAQVTLFSNDATSTTAPSDWTYNIANSSGSYLQLTTSSNYVISKAVDASNCASLTLSYKQRTYGGTSGNSDVVLVQYSTNNGTSWSDLGSTQATSNNLTDKSVDASAVAGMSSVRFRLSVPGATSNKGCGISTIVLTGTESANDGSLISTTTVNGTSHTFTGLTPETTYYARVKGDAGWSNVESFTTNAVLTLANDADNSDAISNAATSGKKYDVTLTGRTLYKDGAWNTLCLPFDVTISDSPLVGADVRELIYGTSGLNGTTLTLNFTDQGAITELVAGTPYIIKWTTTGDPLETPTFNGVTIDNTSTEVSFTGGKFKGTYAPVSFTEENKNVFFMGSSNKLYWPQPTDAQHPVIINAFRCYFELNGTSTVKDFVLNFGEDDVTEVQGVQGVHEVQDESWYDLSGRKVANGKWANRQLPKGIYLYKGRKVIL